MDNHITITGRSETHQVWLNNEELFPNKSQEIYNHSPDGFNWGYEGSGPAQLALAIMLELTTKEKAVKYYQDFKRRYLSMTHQNHDFIMIIDFDNWLKIMGG